MITFWETNHINGSSFDISKNWLYKFLMNKQEVLQNGARFLNKKERSGFVPFITYKCL